MWTFILYNNVFYMVDRDKVKPATLVMKNQYVCQTSLVNYRLFMLIYLFVGPTNRLDSCSIWVNAVTTDIMELWELTKDIYVSTWNFFFLYLSFSSNMDYCINKNSLSFSHSCSTYLHLALSNVSKISILQIYVASIKDEA